MKMTRMLTALPIVAAALFSGCHTYPVQPPPPVYAVNAAATSQDAANLAAGVASDLRGGLERKGCIVVPAGGYAPSPNPVVNINVTLERRETARLDIWRAYEGSATASVVSGGVLYGEKSFAVAGARADSEAAAEAPVRNALSSQILEWLPSVIWEPVPREVQGN